MAPGMLVSVAIGALVALTGSGADRRGEVRDCSPEEAHALVSHFVSAFDAGDRARLERLFAADDGDGDAGTPSFQWYSTTAPGARLGAAASDRSTLVRYFAARHRRGERLRLVFMSGGGNANGYFHFSFRVLRRARDLRPTQFQGKGAAVCTGAGAKIAVWSMTRAAP